MDVSKKVTKTYKLELDEDEMKHIVGLIAMGKKQLDNTETPYNTFEVAVLKYNNRYSLIRNPTNVSVITLRLDRFKSTDITQKLIDNL